MYIVFTYISRWNMILDTEALNLLRCGAVLSSLTSLKEQIELLFKSCPLLQCPPIKCLNKLRLCEFSPVIIRGNIDYEINDICVS